MGIMGKLASGFAGNLSEVSPESLMQEFGMYLMDGETITTGFKLIRDVVIVTNRRIIDFDKQGATGTKMRVDSINLSCIFHVSAGQETGTVKTVALLFRNHSFLCDRSRHRRQSVHALRYSHDLGVGGMSSGQLLYDVF